MTRMKTGLHKLCVLREVDQIKISKKFNHFETLPHPEYMRIEFRFGPFLDPQPTNL